MTAPTKPTGLRQDPASWSAGYAAGLAGKPSDPPPGTRDSLAWISGYIEGQAKREQGYRPPERLN
jgi:ribosome modulation factor